jgi:hypothetical protein
LPVGDARDEVGKVIVVSGKSVDHATKVLNNAVPEVIKAVDGGRRMGDAGVSLRRAGRVGCGRR